MNRKRGLFCYYIPEEYVLENGASQCVTNFCSSLIKGGCFHKFYSEIPTYINDNIIDRLPKYKQIKYIQCRFFSNRHVTRYLNYIIENIELSFLLRKEYNIWFYNLDRNNVLCFLILKFLFKKKLFILLADHTPSKSKMSLKYFAEFLMEKYSSGILSLSVRTTISHDNMQYLPGIIPSESCKYIDKKYPEKSFLFSGALKNVTGIKMVLDVFSELPNIQLYITGRGEEEDVVRSYSLRYNNIHFLGYLEYQQYLDVLDSIPYCLSFRDPNLLENRNNFPSKIMEYFFHSKIVISTINYPELESLHYFYVPFVKEDIKKVIFDIYNLSDSMQQYYMDNTLMISNLYSANAWKEKLHLVEQNI